MPVYALIAREYRDILAINRARFPFVELGFLLCTYVYIVGSLSSVTTRAPGAAVRRWSAYKMRMNGGSS
jgi:hypothetical protein